jgi:hypothetical protein
MCATRKLSDRQDLTVVLERFEQPSRPLQNRLARW